MTKYVFILIGMLALFGLLFVGCDGGGGGSPTEPNPTPTPAPTFTGTFRNEHQDRQEDGSIVNVVDLLILTQNGNTITGTRSANANDATTPCCNASFSTPVTGTADGTNATLTWGAEEGRCEGVNGCWVRVFINESRGAGTFTVTLVNNGSTLRFEDGVEWSRQ